MTCILKEFPNEKHHNQPLKILENPLSNRDSQETTGTQTTNFSPFGSHRNHDGMKNRHYQPQITKSTT